MTVTPYEDGSYRIRQGWVNQVQLPADYEVRRFPKQTGQGYARWLNPVGNSGVYEDFAEARRALSGNAKMIGNAQFTWELAGLTPGMIYYIKNDPALFDGKAAQRFTVMTWDRQGYWRVVWAWGYYEAVSSAGEPGFRRGFTLWRIPFRVVQDAPVAPDLTPTVSRDVADPVPQSSALVFTLGAENVGDGATYADIVVQIDIPVGMTYGTATAGSWALEYFEDGTWVSVISGGVVTAVRGTLGTALAAGTTTSTFQVELTTGVSAGNVDVDVSVTTSGDSNAANDTTTETVTIDAP